MRRGSSLLLPLCLWMIAQAVGYAQDQASADKAPRRILVSFERTLLAGYSEEETRILERAFLTALSDAEGGPLPFESGPKTFPGSLQDRNKVARDAGADCWIWIQVGGTRDRPVLRVASYDLLYNTSIMDLSLPRSEAFSIMDVYRERWDDIIPTLVKKYPPLNAPAYTRGPPDIVALVVRALPGTVISGLTQKPIVVGAEGAASVEIPSPAAYSFRATLAGYMPRTMSFYLNGQPEVVVLQVRSPWLYLDAAYCDGFFPGVAVTAVKWPFPGFARLGFTSYRAGIAVNEDQFFISLPLSQITLLLGSYIAQEDSATRFYLGVGPLLRLTLPQGGSLAVDALLPYGVQLVTGWEFSVTENLRWFVELTPSGYYTPQPAIFQAWFGNNDNSSGGTFPYFTLPPLVAVDPFGLRIGLRWMP